MMPCKRMPLMMMLMMMVEVVVEKWEHPLKWEWEQEKGQKFGALAVV